MTWQSIAIICIMLSCFTYGGRNILLIKKINDSLETDYGRREKVARVKRRLIICSIVTVISIVVLFISELIKKPSNAIR
jgi:hypothetical protein